MNFPCGNAANVIYAYLRGKHFIQDMVIFLPFIESIAKKYGYPISILVKENSKASKYLNNNPNISEIIILDRDNKSKKGRHDGIGGAIRLINDLKKFKFDKVFIFNSSLRFNLISTLAGIKDIYQYPLFEKKNQHIVQAAHTFLKKAVSLPNLDQKQVLVNQVGWAGINIGKVDFHFSQNSDEKKVFGQSIFVKDGLKSI